MGLARVPSWCFADGLAAAIAMTFSLSSATTMDSATIAAPDAAWDAVFDRVEGWTGGDAAYSVDLANGQILWLFADSWIGNVKDGRHAAGSRMVNNTLAIHARPRLGMAPMTDVVRFLWGQKSDGVEPAAWISPQNPQADTLADDNNHNAWYWVADGIVAGSSEGKPRLVLFLWIIAKAGAGTMGFRAAGGAIAIVDNPHDDWSRWKPRQIPIRHSIPSDPADLRRRGEVVWGSEVLIDNNPAGRELLLVYGYRQDVLGQRQLVLARAPAAEVENMDHWEFRTREGWSPRLDDAAALASGLTTEYSISPIPIEGKTRWVLIQSEPMFGSRILARSSASPYGPWSAAKPVHTVSGLDRERKHFTYAAKAHPELSSQDWLLVSYVVNSFDFGENVLNANIYRPRFVRVPLAIVPLPD